MPKRLHAIVHGRVQMVGFRFFVEDEAKSLGLTGWVRNNNTGSTVEVVADGDEAALQRLDAALHKGPLLARVEAVDATWSDVPDEHPQFEVRY